MFYKVVWTPGTLGSRGLHGHPGPKGPRGTTCSQRSQFVKMCNKGISKRKV